MSNNFNPRRPSSSDSLVHHVEDARALLLEICKCPVAVECLTTDSGHSRCQEVVRSQHVSGLADFQVPEPWSGDVVNAPILFVASNPSISTEEAYPRLSWTDDEMVDFFMNRFGSGREDWIKDGTRGLLLDGSYNRGTAFWRFMKNRAGELLQREPDPGRDYALTEIVRCKSADEQGVVTAAETCSERYLKRTLKVSRAHVVVVLGTWAKAYMCRLLGLEQGGVDRLIGPLDAEGRSRLFAFLPHSNARVPRTFATFEQAEVALLRESFRQA